MVCAGRDELVERAQDGDEAAWAELYGDHAERLVVWLQHLRHLDPAADAEDVAAEAWLTAARRVADFEGDRSDFAAWLFGIARNISRSNYRTSRHRQTRPVEPGTFGWDENGGAGSDDPAPHVAGADLTQRLVRRLPEREGQVVACLDVVGLDVTTTSRVLEISPTAVRVAHHRGLHRLRRLLGETTEPDVFVPEPRQVDVTPTAPEVM